MRSLLVVLLFVCGLVGAGEEVTFTRLLPGVGEMPTRTEESSTDFTMDVSVNGKKGRTVTQKESESIELRGIVTGADKEGNRKVRVTCIRAVQRVMDEEGKLHEVPNPCQGKAYDIEVKSNRLKVTAEGREAPPEELDWIRDQFKNLQREDALALLLDGKTMKIGEKLEIPADRAPGLLASLLNVEESAAKVDKFDLTLKAFRKTGLGGFATFQADIAVSQTEGDMKIQMAMTGEVVINAPTCAIRTVHLKGPIKLTGQQVRGNTKIELNGSGTMSAKISYGDN